MRLTNIKSSAPGKALLVVSSVLMLLVWLATAGCLFFYLSVADWDASDWSSEDIMILCLFFFVLIGIPIQLVRYYHDGRRL